MKKFNLNGYIFFFVGLFLLGGVNILIEALSAVSQVIGLGIWYLFKTLPHLPTSFFSMVAQNITANWSLTNIALIDTILVNIATLIPSIISFYISKIGFKLSEGYSALISIIILIAVLELFSSIVFWIMLSISFIVMILTCVLRQNNKRNL